MKVPPRMKEEIAVIGRKTEHHPMWTCRSKCYNSKDTILILDHSCACTSKADSFKMYYLLQKEKKNL